MRWLLILIAFEAQAAPRVMPFLPTPGIALGGVVTGAAFCDTSQRGVFRLLDGSVVSVSAAGDVTKAGTIGAPSSGPMVCDRSDRIFIGANKQLLVIEAGVTKSHAVPADIRHLRVLDDGAVGIVEVSGAVSRYTTALQPLWAAGRALHQQLELDGTAEQILTITASKVEIQDRHGRRAGPPAVNATWLDNTTIVFAERTGAVATWSAVTQAVTKLDVPAVDARVRFVRTFFHRAGKRVVVQRNDLLAAIVLDASAKPTSISRLPVGRRHIAAGNAPFAVIGVNERAFIYDLARSSQAIAHDRPLGTVRGLAFSPDGRSLAMLGGDRDLLIARIDRTAVRRLSTTAFIRQPIRWAPDGSIFTSTGTGHLRWNLDGTVEQRTEGAIGFTPSGGAITATRDARIVIDRGHSEQSFTLSDRTLGPVRAEVTDRHLFVHGFKRVEVHALANPSAAPVLRTKQRAHVRDAALVGEASVMYIDQMGTLFLADAKGERELQRSLIGPTLAVSPDRQRVALATRDAISVWSADGRRVAEVTAGAHVLALAWSPDLRTLAVSTRAGVELWTIPTDARQ